MCPLPIGAGVAPSLRSRPKRCRRRRSARNFTRILELSCEWIGNPNGVVAAPPPAHRLAATPLGLMPARQTLPRVALWAQPWAAGRNPVGCETKFFGGPRESGGGRPHTGTWSRGTVRRASVPECSSPLEPLRWDAEITRVTAAGSVPMKTPLAIFRRLAG